MRLIHTQHRPAQTRVFTGGLLVVLATTALLSACGRGNKPGESSSSGQVAARVGASEISVHQINFALSRRPPAPGLPPEAAASQALDQLINRELAVQAAKHAELDRKPEVMLALEAAQREVLASAFLADVANSAPPATDAEIAAFYSQNPALFADRKIYVVQEFLVDAASEQVQGLAHATKGPDALSTALTQAGIKFQTASAERPAENLPLDLLPKIAALAPGQSLVPSQIAATPARSKVIMVVSSRPAPMSEEQAKAPIARFIETDRKRKLVDGKLTQLRAATKVELLGNYARQQLGVQNAVDPASAAPLTPSTTGPSSTEGQVGQK